jgi:dihydropteroate synthase
MFEMDGRLRSGRPCIVGVVNLTPDSFSDGGRFSSVKEAVACGVAMVNEGAHWLDVGGESTRPGATAVSAEEEISRVVPVVAGLVAALGQRALISVDTYKASTARAALAAGARIVNDVTGGGMDPGILSVAAEFNAPIVLGHLRGEPATMMDNVQFEDVVAEVTAELALCVQAARVAGCRHLWVDPGIGFGKRLPENLAIMGSLSFMRRMLATPMMLGVSRKRFLGELTGRGVDARQYATAAALSVAFQAGVEALRVHDVGSAVDVAAVIAGINQSPPG